MRMREIGRLIETMRDCEFRIVSPQRRGICGEIFQRLTLSSETFLLGIPAELETAVQMKFLVYIVQMDFDCPLTNEEPLCDFCIVQADRYLLDDFDLPRRQHLNGLELSCFTLEQFFERHAYRALLEPELPGVDLADALHEELRRQLFKH